MNFMSECVEINTIHSILSKFTFKCQIYCSRQPILCHYSSCWGITCKAATFTNLVNIYMSSSNRNDSVYTELPDLIFLSCRSVKSQIFFLKNSLKNVQMFETVWLDVVIELISSYWKVIAIWADSYITDIFFSCKCVIYKLTHTRVKTHM